MILRWWERGLLLAGIVLLLVGAVPAQGDVSGRGAVPAQGAVLGRGAVPAQGAGPGRGAVPGQDAVSAQSAGKVQAFLLASAPDSFADLQTHAGSIETVYPTYYECETGSGSIEGRDEPAIDAFAQAHRIPLLPRFNCQDGPTVHAILTEPALRGQTITGLVALARNPAYAGLSLDLENDGVADRSALTAFVTALAARLHAPHRRLTVVVDGVTHEDARRSTGFYDDRALVAVADNVFVLAWGTHWAGSAPGPLCPLPWVREVAAFFASLPHHERFVLAAPMYGLDWPLPAGPAAAYQFTHIAALLRKVGARPLLDHAVDELTFAYSGEGVAHRVWYLDAHAIMNRLAAGRARGLKIGVWRLGGEDQVLWGLPPLAP